MQLMLKRQRLLDGLWLIVLVAYILAGTSEVPFHGDESTTIWMSRDYGYLFLDGELDRVRYSENPISETEQHLRMITGSLTKYAMGLSWVSNGYLTEDINEQWDWGADWNYNYEFGHAPDDTLLMLGRWPSAMMLALGCVVIFLIGKFLFDPRVAYLASLYYALSPGLLLNGRRAMFEGGLIFFSLLTLYMGLWFLRRQQWWKAILLGIATGLAVSAKHPAIFTAMAVYTAIFYEAMVIILNRSDRRREWFVVLGKLVTAGVISLLIFYVMHPLWWDDPVGRVGQVVDARSGILSGQVAAFGGYESQSEQLEGTFRQILIANPQYYEVPGWDVYLADQIDRYESSPWRGISIGGSLVGAVVLILLVIAGIWRIMQQLFLPHFRLFALWCSVMVIAHGLVIPIEWQRYYLMTYPVVGLVAATGIVFIWDQLQVYQRTTRSASESAR